MPVSLSVFKIRVWEWRLDEVTRLVEDTGGVIPITPTVKRIRKTQMERAFFQGIFLGVSRNPPMHRSRRVRIVIIMA